MKLFNYVGKTAVLVSQLFGDGFSHWNSPEMAIDFDLIEAFLAGDISRFEYILTEKYDNEGSLYFTGFEKLHVVWVEEGQKFRINEYDGSENVEVFNEADWFVA